MADKDNKSKLTYHVWDKDNNEYDIPDEVVQQRGMDNFAKDFEGGYITMFDDKKQKVDVPIEDVGEYRKQGYIWYDTSGNATPINEVGKKPSPSSPSKGTEQTQYPQEVIDAFNSPDNKPGNFKDMAQLNDEYQRGELKKPSLISQALGMMPKVDAGNIGREQKMGGMITSMLLGGNEQQAQPLQQPQDNNQQVQQTEQTQQISAKDVDATTGAAPVQQVDAVYNKYVGKGDALSETMYDLMQSGQAQNQEEAQQMAMGAMNRAASRLAQRTTDEFVSKLGDTVEGVDEAVMNGWHSHAVQDKLKKLASQYGIMNSVAVDENGQYITQTNGYDQFINGMVKPAMVESLVKKYGENYRKAAEDLATRLYSNDEVIQNQLMNQDIDEALSSVISKYVNPSVVDEYNKAQEAGSKAFNEGMEGSQNIPASLRLGTAIASQYEANQAKDPQKTLNTLQKKFNGLYKNPQFLNDMSNAAFRVMQRYGMNGTLSGNPKQFKPMIDEVLKAQLNQLEVKNMIPKGSAEYIMNTGLGNTIVGKITRKLVQTDYQNWLEDIANQQYQPGFWERVGSGALTFAGDAWSYWLPGAAGGKVTKSMLAKAEGRLASDLMAKGMEAKMAERAAKVLIGKSKGMALKTGAAHGAVTFGGQSAISKPIDEIYRTGQFDENGKVYNPSVGKILANTLGDVVKQSAVGAIMQGGTIANTVGKGRGLATNILADVGGKVVDSSIMTGQQMLERMAHDPNFKPTGKDAAESFLESMANLTSIGLPGMVGKYARFKDAKEFNRKFDFNDQDIAELKRFGYDDLRDAFEKLGINGYRVDGEGVQMMGQLTDKYMNLMNDKSVPEVLKAKMMAVVEGKRPSSFSPVIDSIIVQPMDNDGKVYLETLNKDGGIIDRKEYSSLDEAHKADKKLDFEKSLNITSEYEKAYHTDALQDRLNTVYEQARNKYAAGEQLSDEDKAAIYLHQNAAAIKDIIQKQQSGMELTEQEQQMVNSYRHFYDSAFENSPIMKEYVRTFEDSQGVEHGTLRKALEGDGKSRTADQQKLVEEYQKQLYNDIVLKREMNDAKEQMNQNLIEGQRELPGATQEGGASAQNAEATAEKPVDASVSSDVPPTEPPTPPVWGETPSNADDTPSVKNNVSPSDADIASNESKSDAYVMGQNAYQNGDAEGLKAIDHNDDVSKARLKRAFAGDEAMMDVVVKAYEEGKDMEQFVAQRANSMTTAQQDAVRKYVEAQDAKKGVYDALQHADDGYGEALKQQLWPYQTEDGNIVPATLTTGQQVFLKKANEYGGGFVVVTDEQGQPTIKQVSSAEIKEVGTPIPMDDYINQQVSEQKNARQQQFFAQYDGSGLKPSDTVEVAMEAGEEPMQMTFAGYSEDGKIVLSDGKDNIALTKDEFNSWRQNALDSSIGAELDAEDVQRANDDAAKAEADKKQRYNEGIVGLGMGQPDYSSKDTEPKVAAEYLQEQFGNDHGKLMNLISGSRSDIKEQLDNKRKAASEYEDWLSLNADLDPEKAQKVENDLALVNELIADLETRYKNWNAIRKEVMTPEEARTLKNERKAEIGKAGVDDSVGSPSDEREVAVLDNKELKKQYPTMDEASNYIASERKRIYHIQNDEVQPQIDDINEALEQYMNGDIDYSADQLKELNTTKAQLEARQANLSASAKDLKAQDKLLNTLYSAENKEERAKAMEEMTPSEQRKALVAVAFKKNDLGAIKEIYKDASVDVMDLTPQTLEEAVSQALSPHSLNAESLQAELGKDNFKYGIGKGYDSNKFNYLLAKKGTGLSVNEFAVRVYNDLPINLQEMGYSDQDVRNTLLDMFKTYDNVKEMRNVALMNRIAAAEEELSSEEEYYEAQKEREIIEKQAEIEEYKAYIRDKALSLPTESELNAIEGMEYDHMMEIEEREREYKQYVKSILPELADYDDRSNEEGYGGGSSLGSDSSRRGVVEGNRQGKEIGGREASSQSETGESTDSGRTGRQETGSLERGEGSVVRGSHLPQEASFGERLKGAIAETEPNPSEAQKKAGNYKKGHLSFGGYDFTVETPKGITRSGKDEQGKPWSVTMHDTYGYILGKIGVDGDHIDMFINDAADLDTFDGNVYVVDQVNPETGEFDEHKVMYGYPSEEAATEAYLSNYSKGWKGLGKVTAVPKATFDKWLEASDRKTKPFADYAIVQKEQTKFDRDVKELKPSEMTEAQKVAYDAVSTMLKKAGIPVKVVSNEDMEKVAEAQDNLNLAMLLNQPEMRFKIKTPEEKQAAENAYNFAKELRPDKWKQYAVVDMSNPNKMPEYFEKQELARQERSYYNKLMWGNYKVFNLNKSFEDNVAGLTGSFPSEFDPYKIDEQTNKKNELKKQIKETEDAYNSTGQERNNYQIQLMKEYMDEHGLASENDIPDDVWNDCRNKSFEKYQDKLDSLFAKYKDLDRQLKAIVQPGVRFLRTYHGTGASFDKFDFSHMGEGEGSQAFGWGGYVTNSKEIAEDYTRRAKMRKNNGGFEFVTDLSESNKDMVRHYIYKYKDVDKGLDAMRKDLSSALEMFPDDDDLKELSNILAKKNEEIAVPDDIAYLYDVDIPDDNGDYLDWENKLKKSHLNKVNKELVRIGKEPIDTIYPSRVDGKVRGQDLYDELSSMLGSKEAASKLLSDAGFVGIKYPAGTIYGGAEKGDYNYVIFDENNANIVGNTKFAQGKGVVYGYTDGKEIVLNQEHLNPNTPIHEYQHLWRTAAKNMNPELIEHGDKLIMQTQLFADLKEDPNYKHLSDDEICDEAFARLTGEDGAAILEQMAKDAIKENPLDTAKELTIINRLKDWLKKFWYWTLDTFTKWKPEDIKKMTLEDIRNLVLRDLANGVDPRNVKSRLTKDDAISLRQQMEDNAEQERVLEHTEENWLKEFGKDGRVSTPIGSIKLGENQYKKAGREDRIKRFGLLKPTLERPDVILEKSAPKEGAERQTKYLFIKSFKKADGTKILNYESITVKQGEDEVAISAHQIEPSKVVKELTESKVLWNRFRGDSNSLGENQGSALTPSANNPSGKDSVLNPHSDAKIRNNIETAKENGGNLSVEDKIKAVSQQFGVDEADVAMYANAIKKGSTAEAARARANIKRHLMQVNEGNIFSFKDVVKYTKPINEALKVNFGDLDAMIEERVQQVEAQRNAMEAARKRAEEEEAKRQKHLEELSLIPDDQLDKQYMDALAKGDDATAREMLDEAARRKGYDDTESAYQGVGAWAAPGNPGYESDKARRDDWESSGSDVNLEDMALGYTPQPDDYFSHPERYSQNTPHGLESVKAINTAIDAIKNGEKDVKVKVYRAVPTSVKEGKLRNGDWVTPSKKYAEMHGANRLEGKYRIIEDEVPATQLWWDGNDANEFGFDDGKEYKYKNAKNNRKLNDLVTYDDEGDVIPPSKRFNSRKQDVRFHRVTEPEELERLNKEKTFRMYSGMQELDGKLYSPMAAIIDGKRTDATEIGAWMGADERPDLVKGGKFQLVKTDKNPGAGEGPVRAAYNPYMHTSTSMMNDQFTGAYARGNIKVVEWEIPESEKTSGYRAEGAKDAVGLVPWHSGSVNGLLPKDRQRSVMLSRWRKAVRVVPDSEVAESIAEQLEGTGLAIPWNVVTPNQLRELVKLGVPITTEESGQQAPETKEKFMAQMEELKKEFPQAQFVDVKMTKDAFKEWGKKANVKSRLVESFEKEKARIVSEAKEKGSYMLAPNGNKSKLDAEQWATVRTANFKKWFGDWENDPENASKVLDENGEPMVVYHGRSADFNTFEKKEGVRFIMGLEDKVKAEGFFFSPDRALAEEFAGNAARHRGGKANVVPCYLNIRKPMDLTGEDYDRIYEDVTGWDYTVGMDTQDNLWGIMDEEGMADKIKEKGYDGAIFVEEVDDNYEPTKISYCALDANQVKSADKNNGEFSSRNNDIRFRFGEPYDYEKYPLGRVEPNLATKEVKIVHADANHGFKDYKEAKNWAIGNICRTYSSDETGNKGEVIINKDVVSKYVSKAARDQSDNDDVHYAVLKVLPDVIREGIEAETHPNFNKVGNARKPEYGYDNHLLIHRVYGAVDIDGVVYRVKITMKENMQDRSLPNKPYSYEVTDISTKIEPLEAIDAQVQDHGSHSNDSISGTNLLKKVEMSYDKGKKLLDESEKMGISIENQRKIADSVVNTANKLGGAEATVYSSLDDVPEEYRPEVEQGAKGWYDPETHSVHVYLPNCEDGNDAQRTVFHEKIGHEGMEVLLGGEQGVRKFADFVYKSVGKETRGKILDFANKYDPGWSNPDRINVGTQEYIAHLAEEGPKTAEDFSLWTKIKHYLIKVLKKLGVRVPGLLNDKDLRYYLMKAGKALHVWDEMPQEKQEAMMKQASNAEIKDSLGDGAGKGKPRQKKGESAIQYMKRVMEWKRWKEAREDENDPEPPMFYDFDKDAEGKKDWERLNKEWRDSHHLQGDEMPIKPERKEGETDEEFFPRYKEWEKWNDAMADKENPMPDMFSFEKAKQDEARQKYEDWLTRHELNEQNDADLDLYEGKIYPAETNPEADALEQRVMQDLAEVTSTDVSKEGAARSVHDAVIYRRKNIESASATDAIFINSVKQELNKMANASYLGRKADAIADVVKETVTGKTPKTQAKRMAEAIPYIIEAPRRMRDIANELNAVGAFENGHIHVTANDIDAIQPFTEELRNLASKNHKVVKDGKETIVYDDVPSMAEVASKMAKEINDNHVGEEGFVPVDGTDILAEHVVPVVLKRIVPQGIEYKNLSEEMQSLLDKIREWYDKTFTWLKDSHTVREDIGYTADYVNHRWDKEKSDDKAYADLVEGRQRTKSPNEKPRKVSTYMEGVDAGLVPKTTDITDLLAYYSQSNIEAFANKTFLQELSGINVIERNKDGEITSTMPLLSSIQPKELMVDENKYTPYVVPGINTVWVYNQGKIFNKSAEDWFNAAFGTVKLPKVLKGVKNAMSIAKTLELGFSGFHAGALTEVYAVQNSAEFGPAKAMAYFMKYLITDTAKTHQLPSFANPEAFKEAAKHLVKFGSASDYATADIENLYEKVHSYVAKLHSKLVEGNVAMKAGSSVTFPLEVATELLRMSQKGLDVALWSYLHDGLKLATYQLRAERTRERAKKLNWDEDMLNKALDEDGQFVNDMFGGQHFDVLGISKKMQTILDFIFLSKDWLISTTRHALSIFGYGSIWNEASIKNFWEYYKHVLGRGEMTKEDYLRLSRSKSGLLCYGVGFMIGYEGLSQLVNAAMRAWDEEKQKEKADEIRKTNPSYKSPYELAYPDGMHWYDYLMRGNSLGQQSKIFMGRYADGTEMYIRHGKQFREIPELFFDAKDNFAIPGPMVRRMYGKSSPLLRGMIDTYKWYLSPDYGDKEMQRKYGENLGLIPKLASYYIPFAVPTQKDKEFKMLDLVFPSSKGFSRYKAQDYFKTFIMSEDKQGLAMTYNACVQNGIDPEEQLKAAISSVKALEASEMQDGVTSLQVASERFDEAKSITEKKKMRQKMKKFLSQSEYKAFTQKEALDMVQSYLNGEDDLKEMEKAENKYLMKAKSEDVTEDWRIQAIWNGTMETYDEYQRLKDVDKAKANAFKNSKTNKRLFAARKAISAAKKKMNKAKKQMDGQNDAAKMVEIRKTRKELLKTLNGME